MSDVSPRAHSFTDNTTNHSDVFVKIKGVTSKKDGNLDIGFWKFLPETTLKVS